MIKRGIALIFVLLLSLPGIKVSAQQTTDALDVDCTYAIAVDMDTMQVLYGKAQDQRLYPASITKVLTALTALDHISDLDDQVTVTLEMLEGLEDGTYTLTGLINGETITFRDLLNSALLLSGADSCQALAVSLFGSKEAMVDAMNAKAQELGMENSHFTNTVGMHDEEHYTNAVDLALLMKAAWANEDLRQAMSTKKMSTAESFYHGEGIELYNSWAQQMDISQMSSAYVQGGKTGFTPEAGFCFAAVCQIQGRRVIVITAQSDLKYEQGASLQEAEEICQYIDEQMVSVRVAEKDETLSALKLRNTFHAPIDLKVSEDLYVWVREEQKEDLQVNVDIKKNKAAVQQGELLATAEVESDGETLVSVPIYAQETVESDTAAVVFDSIKAVVFPYGIAIVGVMICLYGMRRRQQKKKHAL